MFVRFIGFNCFVQQSLGLRFVIKSQPALIIHTGNSIPVCVPLISSVQNAEFPLIHNCPLIYSVSDGRGKEQCI